MCLEVAECFDMSEHFSINTAEKQEDHQLVNNCHENSKTYINWIFFEESECAISINCPTQQNMLEIQSLRQILNSCIMWHIFSLPLISLHNHMQFCSSQCCHYSTMHIAKNSVCLPISQGEGKERKGKEKRGGKTMNKNILFLVTIFLCHVRPPILHFSVYLRHWHYAKDVVCVLEFVKFTDTM